MMKTADSQPVFFFDAEFTGEGCRVLYFEMLKRAIYDWILYRDSRRMSHKIIAQEAHFWLFEEDATGILAAQRKNCGRVATSFHSICAALDLNPEDVRKRAREITSKQVLNLGRPRIHRRRKDAQVEESSGVGEVLHLEELQSAARAQPRDMLSGGTSQYAWGR